MDPIQEAARKRAAHDDFYDVTFESKKPLGVTLEQVNSRPYKSENLFNQV